MRKLVVVGFGHRARQGKDFAAAHLAELKFRGLERKPQIIKFADDLYKEAYNEGNVIPLLQVIDYGFKTFMSIKGTGADGEQIRIYKPNEIPSIAEFMEIRKIKQYVKMEGKDSEFLQIWGTEVRRKLWGENYWVDKAEQALQKIRTEGNGTHFVFITDTRFYNEVNLIKKWSGYYTDVIRLNEDGSRYYADDRDRYHQSEAELDGYKSDFQIIAKTGDLETLYKQAEDVAIDILMKEEIE